MEPTEAAAGFPLKAISYSAMRQFSVNPVLFRVRYINGDKIDGARSAGSMLGNAFHEAMERYHGGNLWEIDGRMEERPGTADEALLRALTAGQEFIDLVRDDMVEWSKAIPDKGRARERVAAAIRWYHEETEWDPARVVAVEEKIVEMADVEWRGQRVRTPVPLSGIPDKLFEGPDGLEVEDYKTCYQFSDDTRIDGSKLLQAVEYYFLAHAKYGRAPVACTFTEVKYAEAKDRTQVRRFRLVYAEQQFAFDLWFRFFADMVRAVNGEAVWPPNIDARFDNELALVAYAHRLDVPEEVAALQRKHGAETLTEVLRGEIARGANNRRLLASIEKSMLPAKPIDYSKMEIHDQIAAKMHEFGKAMRHDSTVEGATVDLHRFTPSTGIKLSELRKFEDDLSMATGVAGVRVIAPIPGTRFVGVEVPRAKRRFPALPPPDADPWQLAIGETTSGEPRRADLRDMPHLLVAGATGSGKTVFLQSLVDQLRAAGAELRICDPKEVDFAGDEDAVSGMAEMTRKIADTVEEMDARYKRLKKLKKRTAREAEMTTIALVVDEYADLIMLAADEGATQRNVMRLAQKGRAAGIHVVLATQRASAKLVGGDVKANFTTKAVFRMAKAVDSVVMLDEPGAEKLLGKGDFLLQTADGIERLQGYSG